MELLIVLLLMGWLLGYIAFSAGGLIHVLLVIAVVVLLVRLIQNRRV